MFSVYGGYVLPRINAVRLPVDVSEFIASAFELMGFTEVVNCFVRNG